MNEVFALAVQSDGKIVIGGGFTNIDYLFGRSAAGASLTGLNHSNTWNLPVSSSATYSNSTGNRPNESASIPPVQGPSAPPAY